MTLQLTEEQVRAVAAHSHEPVRLIDPNTNESFVLLRGEDYERIRSLLEDDFDIRDTYAAQFASALHAGWDDPAMDDYDNYDEAYKKLCQSPEAQSS
jgi:hypothetical protein